jgi:hypothetical protein
MDITLFGRRFECVSACWLSNAARHRGWQCVPGVLSGEFVGSGQQSCMLCGKTMQVIKTRDKGMFIGFLSGTLQGFRSAEEVANFGDMMQEMGYIVATKYGGSLKVLLCCPDPSPCQCLLCCRGTPVVL